MQYTDNTSVDWSFARRLQLEISKRAGWGGRELDGRQIEEEVSNPPPNRPQTKLTIVCAWCQKPMGTKDGEGQTGVSHSICPKCYEKMMEGK